jgi:hypothetical protein
MLLKIKQKQNFKSFLNAVEIYFIKTKYNYILKKLNLFSICIEKSKTVYIYGVNYGYQQFQQPLIN